MSDPASDPPVPSAFSVTSEDVRKALDAGFAPDEAVFMLALDANPTTVCLLVGPAVRAGGIPDIPEPDLASSDQRAIFVCPMVNGPSDIRKEADDTMQLIQALVFNRLLSACSAEDFTALSANFEPIDLPLGTSIEEPNVPVDHVVFFETGIGSVIVVGSRERDSEVGHIGREGMTGRAVVLGSSWAANRIVMQVAGRGFRIPVEALQAAIANSPALDGLFKRYIVTSDAQASHTLLAATRFVVSQRLARWILMYHDRLDGDLIPVTHDILSTMLGVRRAGVTAAMHVLEGIRGIKATRGTVRMLDREILQEHADGCYGHPEAEYDRLIGVAPD